ncbi:hypothetical protein CG723_45255 [Streptomyces sp. CB01635]|uniref:hypothetical protein n=1 Tax=unclassified Streptomyces TaxID=2593676 RepID=UPI000C280DE4|nr:hypothetical protein [Streptomyces sp. CB01635]PJN05345.1 hypothetical protein CG723_45255 [Streptomyces sp. CB01635]
MESAIVARERLLARKQELRDELEQVQRHLEQLETTVVASQWRHAPSGPMGRGTVYHTGTDDRCRLTNGPETITLYEALQTGLAPCSRCRPKQS